VYDNLINEWVKVNQNVNNCNNLRIEE
jgi:hypothetical protein